MKTNQNNLLIIEDNQFIGQKIYNATKKINCIESICISETLQEAFSILKKTNFKFITLDLRLPDGNGIELLKKLKEEKTETKVLVFSMSTELKQICLNYGAFAFFDKATDFDKLINALNIN